MLETVLALALLAGQNASRVAPEETFHITIVVIRMRSISDMLRACNEGPGAIHGCTHIVGEVLTTECGESAGRWKLAARGTARALIRTVESDVVGHELKHVRDISDAANGLMARAAVEYRSEEDCQAAASSLTMRFRTDLQEVARNSQGRRN